MDIIQQKIDEKFRVIESKLRNSFQEIKQDNLTIKSKINEITEVLNELNFKGEMAVFKSYLYKELENLNKRLDSNENSFKKFQKEISRTKLKKEISNEVYPLLNKKISEKGSIFSDNTKELRKEIAQLKSEKTRQTEIALEEFEKKFESLRKDFAGKISEERKALEKEKEESVAKFRTFKQSVGREIGSHKSLVDGYSAKIEAYSLELEKDYEKSKKEIMNNAEKKINSLREEKDGEIKRLQGQISNLKGRVKDTEKVSVPKEKVFSKIVSSLADDSEKAKKQVKQLKKEDRGFFSKIVKSLAD